LIGGFEAIPSPGPWEVEDAPGEANDAGHWIVMAGDARRARSANELSQ
jgi:hypothetical protein